MSDHTDLIGSYLLLITAACTNTGDKMKGSHSRAADRCPHSLSQVTSFMQLGMLWESRHSLFECVYQIWGLYIIFKAMYENKWFGTIFGCKVGQSVQIVMKLEFDVWHHPLNLYSKFQTDISKHVQKSPENFSLAGNSSNTPFQVF